MGSHVDSTKCTLCRLYAGIAALHWAEARTVQERTDEYVTTIVKRQCVPPIVKRRFATPQREGFSPPVQPAEKSPFFHLDKNANINSAAPASGKGENINN